MRHILIAGIIWCLPAALFAQQRSEPRHAVEPKSGESRPLVLGGGEATVSNAVDELVAQLRRTPARPSNGAGRIGVLLIDAKGGEATLIAEEMDALLIRCGSPVWSNDGKRILFDATPGNKDYTSRGSWGSS